MFARLHFPEAARRSIRPFVLLAVLAVPAAAQQSSRAGQGRDSSDVDLTELSLEELLEIQVESVSGASKHAQRTTEAPSSVSIVTRSDIAGSGARTLADVLRGVRSFYVTNDRNYERIGVRGFAPPGDYNGRVLLLVDGHRTNNNVYDSASVGLDFLLDLDLVERLEVVRGPGSSLYGSSAFFGVLDVHARSGASVGGVELASEIGSFETQRARATFGRELDGGLDLLVSASVFGARGPGLFYEEFASDPSGGFTSDTDDESGYSLFGQAQWKGVRLQGAFVSREKGIPTGSFGTVFDDPENETLDAQGYVDLSYEASEEGEWEFGGRVFADGYDYRGKYIYDDTANGGPPDLLNDDRGSGRWWGMETHYTSHRLAGQHITVGAELRDDLRQDQSNFDSGAIYLDDERNGGSLGLYAQDELLLSPSLRLDAGVRLDEGPTIDGSWSPRLALIWNPDPDSAVKLLAGQAFRAPNAYELYYGDGFSQKPNAGLDSERIHSYELAAETTLSERWRGAFSLYHYDIEDLLVLTTDSSDGLLVFDNAEDVSANGLELELEHRFQSGARVLASQTWQRAENQGTGDRIANSPAVLGKVFAEMPLVEERLWAGVELQYTSERETLSGGSVEGFTRVNLNLRAAELAPGLDAALTLSNFFDADYADPAGGEHLQDALDRDGRTVLFRLIWRP